MANDPKKDGDGKEPERKDAPVNGESKPGLTIDFVLPEKEEEEEDDKELGKRH